MLQVKLPLLVMSYVLAGHVWGNKIDSKTGREKEDISITCTFIFSGSYPCIFWYKQKPNSALQFILRRSGVTSGCGSYNANNNNKFNAEANPTSSTLTISTLELSDTAVYYCAVADFIYGTYIDKEALVFGTGTHLNVLPSEKETSVPSVYVLKSQTEKDSTACLVKDFYPEDVKIFMNSSTKDTGLIEASPVLSHQGKYSAVHVDRLQGENIECLAEHQGKLTRDGDITLRHKDPFVQTEYSDVNIKECEKPTERPAENSERMNTLSMTVLGLRMLCAKALAFNLLLTAKFFIC